MVEINQTITDYIRKHEPEIIEMRQFLHTHPEESMEEYKTTDYIAERLDQIDGVEYKRLDPTGIIGEIKGENSESDKTVLLRADIDALPITELNKDLDYISQNEGKMHACGHDTHISMLYAALKALSEVRTELEGTVRFVFQPAEETAEGAKLAIEQGVLKNVDNAFGIHIWSNAETGKVNVPIGPSFAATDEFKVYFRGKGGHGAMPHQSNDTMIMVAQYINAVQTLVSRETDPLKGAVVTLGTVEAGDRFNVIAENARFTGTVRTYDPSIRDNIEEKLTTFADYIAKMHGGKAKVEYNRLTDAVNNEKKSAQLANKITAEAFGEKYVADDPATMGGEDFGYYMSEIPGAFATVGSANKEKATDYPHHSAHFNVDEEALKVGAELYAQYAYNYLNQNEF